MARVITYESDYGRVNVCLECKHSMEMDGVWLHDRTGRELSDIYHGEHDGGCNVCEQIAVEDGRKERQTQTLDELEVTVY